MSSRGLRRENLSSSSKPRTGGLAGAGAARPRGRGVGGGGLSAQERPKVLGRGEENEVRYLGPTPGNKARSTSAERLKATITVSQVLSFYGQDQIRFAGRWEAVRCPFHDDGHASASYNDVIGQFYCHACGVHGDIFDLIQSEEGIGFPEAVAFIEREF